MPSFSMAPRQSPLLLTVWKQPARHFFFAAAKQMAKLAQPSRVLLRLLIVIYQNCFEFMIKF